MLIYGVWKMLLYPILIAFVVCSPVDLSASKQNLAKRSAEPEFREWKRSVDVDVAKRSAEPHYQNKMKREAEPLKNVMNPEVNVVKRSAEPDYRNRL